MTVYKENNWGADADGNRGIPITEVELEPSDEPLIIAELNKMVEEGLYDSIQDMPKKVSIWLYCDIIGDEVEFEVYPKDYL